jgi:hypothetical protein
LEDHRLDAGRLRFAEDEVPEAVDDVFTLVHPRCLAARAEAARGPRHVDGGVGELCCTSLALCSPRYPVERHDDQVVRPLRASPPAIASRTSAGRPCSRVHHLDALDGALVDVAEPK